MELALKNRHSDVTANCSGTILENQEILQGQAAELAEEHCFMLTSKVIENRNDKSTEERLDVENRH